MKRLRSNESSLKINLLVVRTLIGSMDSTSPVHLSEQIILLLEHSPLATAVFENSRMVWSNRALKEVFGDFSSEGWTLEELVTRIIPNVHMRAAILEQDLKNSAEASQPVHRPLSVECSRKGGELLQCEFTSSHFDQHLLLHINVISTFRYNAEILCETHKMASLGRLSEGLAHEINNPLAAIGQNLQLIWQRLLINNRKNKKIADKCGISLQAIEEYLGNQGILEMFETVLEQNIRASKIVHEMLQFAPNDRSHDYYPQNVQELLEQSLLLARKDYFQNTPMGLEHVKVQISVAEDVPQIVCQAWKIQQAFFAVIKNAVEAIQKKFGLTHEGCLTVTVRNCDRNVQIRFEDNGVGMDEETQQKVFEPYFTTKPGNLGTGLGLASCFYIVHQEHFGNISVKSTLGEGTAFTISIPYGNKSLNNLSAKRHPPS